MSELTPAQVVMAKAMTERELLDAVVACARTYGWLAYHGRPARTQKGWVTAIQGDAGFPDLVLARDGVVIFVELKREGGKLTVEQGEWQDALQPSGMHAITARLVHAVVWLPSDWLCGGIEEMLRVAALAPAGC